MLVVRQGGSALIVATRYPIRLGLALLAAAIALGVLYSALKGDPGRTGVFFYDPSASRLFVASIGSIPPIRGVDGPEEDAVRAVVVSITGKPEDRPSRRIAYLERYSPELKRQLEAARSEGGPAPMGRSEAASHRWVRRTNDTDWVPLASETGERIVSDWAVPGPDGISPVVCLP
jgi:hypothetical protein